MYTAGQPGCLGHRHQPGCLDIGAPGFYFRRTRSHLKNRILVQVMEIKLTQFEVKYSDNNSWEAISEKIVMEELLDAFSMVTPVITDMLEGKYAYTPHGIYRMKLEDKAAGDF
jgi:hypothetical protein